MSHSSREASERWTLLNNQIQACRRCPRLIEHCTTIARTRRRAYADWTYWGQPVPNFGDPNAELLIVGLAPAAHGANRTGRMFTGDRSGDWLYRALHRAGLASQPESLDIHDGMELLNCAITAACHCAPPENKPTREELATCAGWFEQTVNLLPLKGFLALGQIGWRCVLDRVRPLGWHTGKLPHFGHCAEVEFQNGTWMIGSYHPSQQNTFTGKLTEDMFDAVMNRIQQRLKSA